MYSVLCMCLNCVTYLLQFEVSPEDDPEHVIVGSSAAECHKNLLETINSAR